MKIGDRYKTKEGCELEIIEYKNCEKVLIKFLDEFEYTRYAQAIHIRGGRVKNPYHPSVSGAGYIGVGDFTVSKNGKLTREYICWKSMVERCYDKLIKIKRPTYKDVGLCKEWHNFQVFAEWCGKQIGSKNNGWHLDKDLLVTGNKIYSPNTCIFLPREINNFLSLPRKASKIEPTGVFFEESSGRYVASCNDGCRQRNLGRFKSIEKAHNTYKEFKESVAKELAIKWEKHIDKRAYQALINYQLEEEE